MLKLMRRVPFFKVLAIGKAALLARRHLRRLEPPERRRLTELLRQAHRLSGAERDELRQLVAKLEPRAFAIAAANEISPIRIPRRLAR
jgi:hypothetical protein